MTCHAIERARERYGVELTWAHIDWLQAALADDSPFVVRIGYRPDGTLLVAACFDGLWIPFLIDAAGMVVTALSPNAFENHRRMLALRTGQLQAMGLLPATAT